MALLDKLRTDCMNKAATTLQKGVRGFLARRRFAAAKRSVLLLQAAVRGYFARMEFKRKFTHGGGSYGIYGSAYGFVYLTIHPGMHLTAI